MSVIEDIKQRSDIVEVIGQYTTLKKAGRTYRGLCPFHNEKTPSFFVYPEQQSWHCFGACSTGGDVFAFVMKKQGVAFGEALQMLADRAGIPVPVFNERPGEKKEKDRLFEANLAAVNYYHEMFLNAGSAEKARKYIAKRGLDLKTIMQFQFGYSTNDWDSLRQHLNSRGFTDKELITAGLIMETEEKRIHDRFRNKLMIPIYDIKNNVCGFGARVLDESELKTGPKYINSPQTPVFDKSGTLYGINFASESIRKLDRVVIVEGYMDVVVAHQYGYTNVVASMGTAINEKQINIIKRLTRNVSLALDPDAAGEKAMLQGLNYENLLDSEVKVVLLPGGKDPDEVIKENTAAWPQLISAGIPVVDYTFNTVTAGLNLKSVRDKTTVVDKLLPIIGSIKNDVRRDHYLNKLAEMTGTSYRSMEMALSKVKSTGKTPAARETAVRVTGSFLRSPIEEYLLSLLFQHPEIRSLACDLSPEYFENSENHELFMAWMANSDIGELKTLLDNSIREHLELLLAKKLPDTSLETKYNDCSLRLHEKYLRNLERKKEQVLASEREERGVEAELAKQSEQGTGVSENLKSVFTKRSQYQKR